LLQNGVFHFVFRVSQSSEIACCKVRISADEELNFSKKDLALKGLID